MGLRRRRYLPEMDRRRGIRRVRHIPDDLMSGVHNVEISNGHTYPSCFQINKHMMILVNRMQVGIGSPTSPLEIFPAYKTSIYVYIRERDRAKLLEVEIERGAVHLNIITDFRNTTKERKTTKPHGIEI